MGIQESEISTAHMIQMLHNLVNLAVKQDKMLLAYILGMALIEAETKPQKANQ
jgi:hypothetical protein